LPQYEELSAEEKANPSAELLGHINQALVNNQRIDVRYMEMLSRAYENKHKARLAAAEGKNREEKGPLPPPPAPPPVPSPGEVKEAPIVPGPPPVPVVPGTSSTIQFIQHIIQFI
jgi:hypothetical protein